MISIGDKAKDIITEFTGVVVAYSTHLHNSDRVALQPRELVDGKPADAVWFDLPQVELVEVGVIPFVKAVHSDIQLGDKVTDTLSKSKGVITGIVLWNNGCRRMCLQPTALKDGTPVDDAWFAAQQLKLLKAAKPQTKKPPGGPMDNPVRMRNPR